MLGLGDWAGSYCLCLEQMGNVIPSGLRQPRRDDRSLYTNITGTMEMTRAWRPQRKQMMEYVQGGSESIFVCLY